MRNPYGVSVTVLLETEDRHGDDTLTVDTTIGDDGVLADCAWAPATSSETEDGRSQVIRGRTLYPPPDSGITPHHRIRFPDNSVWRVVGDVGEWRSPFTGRAPGDEVHLERVTG